MAAECSVFSREGEYWTISYCDTLCRLRDAAGLRYLATLLGRPRQSLPAVELVQAWRLAADRLTCVGGDGSVFPRRTPIASTTHEAERARVTVTRSIRAAMQRIAVHNPPLGEHLAATIKTGTCCVYTPDPRLPVTWELDID